MCFCALGRICCLHHFAWPGRRPASPGRRRMFRDVAAPPSVNLTGEAVEDGRQRRNVLKGLLHS